MRPIMDLLLAAAVSTVLASPSNSTHRNVGASACGIPVPDEKMLLDALNTFKDPLINPAIDQELPDPLNINVGKSGSADAGCIIPNPFGGCICRASAGYSVSLQEVRGLKGLKIQSFTTAQIRNASVEGLDLDVTLGADINEPDLIVDRGAAHASASACGISPSASGTASTHATPQKPTVTVFGKGKVNLQKKCVQISFSKISVNLPQLSIHDTSVTINVGPIPGIDIGKLVDLVANMAPDLTKKIADAIEDPLSSGLTSAANKLPCIPIFHEASPCSREQAQILV